MFVRSCVLPGLLLAVSFVHTAHADDIAISTMSTSADDDGRYEIFALAQDGNLYHRWQSNAAAPSWAPWVLRDTGPISRVASAKNFKSHEIYVATLRAGQIRVQHQNGAGGGFSPSPPVMGSNFNSLALAATPAGQMEVFVIGQDGTLGRFLQVTEDTWGPYKSLGGHDLMAGGVPTSGPLAGFIVKPNALGAAMALDDKVHAFAVGGDGILYDYAEDGSGAGSWTSLQGDGLVDVSALSASGVPLTVFALDRNNRLSSRTQTSNGSFGPWVSVFALPVAGWTAAIAPDGTITVVGQSSSGPIAATGTGSQWSDAAAITAEDGWTSNGAGGSLIVLSRSQSALFELDGTGQAYQLPGTQDQVGRTFEQQDKSAWQWLGGATVSPNPEDYAMQAGCLPVELDGLLKSSIQGAITSQITGSDLAELARHVSIVSNCSNSIETLGVWLSRVPTDSVLQNIDLRKPAGRTQDEGLALALTWSGIQRVFAVAWKGLPKVYDLSGNPDRHGDVSLSSYSLSAANNKMNLKISGSALSTPLTINVSATISVTNSQPSCQVKIGLSSPLTAILTGFTGGADIATAFGLYDGLASELSMAQSGVASNAQPLLCQIVKAFPVTVVPPAADVGGKLEKFTFLYDLAQADEIDGLRLFAGTIPIPEARHPNVVWNYLPGAKRPLPQSVLMHVIAAATDFRNPSFSWSMSWPGASWKPANASGQLADITFPILPNTTLKNLKLGTLTVSVVDDDHLPPVVQTAPVVLTDFVLATPPTNVKPPRPPKRID